LDAASFRQVTGMSAPPSPVTAESYAAAGLPFFSLPAEKPSGIKGIFSDIKSVAALDKELMGKKTLDRTLRFRTVEIDPKINIPFRAVSDLEAQVKGLGIHSFG
jgi:hypothetical protein